MVDSPAPWDAWNVAVFLQIHATAASPDWLIELASWLSELPLYVALALTAWELFRHRDRNGAIRMLIAFAIALSIEAIISAFDFQPRPFAAGFGPARVQHAANNSMPSTHVTLTCIMAITLALRRRLWSAAVVAGSAIALAWARVYVGIHWPADMVGAVISACIAVALAAGFVQAGKQLLAFHKRGSDP